jgi:hypothetical protein
MNDIGRKYNFEGSFYEKDAFWVLVTGLAGFFTSCLSVSRPTFNRVQIPFYQY